MQHYDTIVIGGGFYGCMIALHLQKRGEKVLIIEKEADIMRKASFSNQARVHNGYHYPRSFKTALSSHKNYSKFIADFKGAVSDDYEMIYAIAKGSRTTVQYFKDLYKKIGCPLEETSKEVKALFNHDLVRATFKVDEKAFDASVVRSIILRRLIQAEIRVELKMEVVSVQEGAVYTRYNVQSDGSSYGSGIQAKRIINCTYAGINGLLKKSNLPLLRIKLENTEMPLVIVPTELQKRGITIMDGPYFSMFPFPAFNMHSIHHVTLTPKKELDAQGYTNFYDIINHASQFIPLLAECYQKGSINEVKAVLKENEIDDGRPVLFKQDYGIKGYDIVLGGKIDNIYDVLDKLDGKEDETLNVMS